MSKHEQEGGDGHVVSVVIPSMGRPTIELCEAALRSQTRPPDEIIIVRDEEWKGIGRARNAGIARSKGDLIALTDDDTVPPPDWLERLVRAFVAAFWQKAVGPFSIAAFSSKRNFFMFWLGEKFQGMGFVWGLMQSRGQSR